MTRTGADDKLYDRYDLNEENSVIVQYLNAALDQARYEIIDDEEPYYGEIPGFDGVWASGSTLEACRRNLVAALEDWIVFSHGSCARPV